MAICRLRRVAAFIYVASKESVVSPKTPTKIHFDIHRNINTFVNHKQLREKLDESIKKNRKRLFARQGASPGLTAIDDN